MKAERKIVRVFREITRVQIVRSSSHLLGMPCVCVGVVALADLLDSCSCLATINDSIRVGEVEARIAAFLCLPLGTLPGEATMSFGVSECVELAFSASRGVVGVALNLGGVASGRRAASRGLE